MKFEIIQKGKKWYYRILAGNGKVLAHSEFYTRRRSVMDAIALIQNGAGAAPVVDA